MNKHDKVASRCKLKEMLKEVLQVEGEMTLDRKLESTQILMNAKNCKYNGKG